MDHMRISGTECSYAKQRSFKKLKSDALNMPKQAEAKNDCLINPQNYNCNQIQHRKIWFIDVIKDIPKIFLYSITCHEHICGIKYENKIFTKPHYNIYFKNFILSIYSYITFSVNSTWCVFILSVIYTMIWSIGHFIVMFNLGWYLLIYRRNSWLISGAW